MLTLHFIAFGKVLNVFANVFDYARHIHTQDGGVLFDENASLLDLVVDWIQGGGVDLDEELSLAKARDVSMADNEFSLLRLQEQCFLLLGCHFWVVQ
jgi:hypothetical protein